MLCGVGVRRGDSIAWKITKFNAIFYSEVTKTMKVDVPEGGKLGGTSIWAG